MKWITLLALFAVAFAGCTDEPAEAAGAEAEATDHVDDVHAADDTHSEGDESTEAANETQTPVNETAPANTAPEGHVTADHLEGSAGITLTFTVNVTDADSDTLAWNLSLADLVLGEGADNGTVEHTFEDEGEFLVVLNVTDGTDFHASNLTITITTPQPTGPCGAEPEPCKLDENDHVEFWSDGVCQVKDEIGNDALGWIRQEPFMGIPGGNSLWVYEETNGMTGLQVHGDEGGDYADCVDGDTIHF